MCHEEFVAKSLESQKQAVHIAYSGNLGIIECKKVFWVDFDLFI